MDTVQVYDSRGKLVYQTHDRHRRADRGLPRRRPRAVEPRRSSENVVETQREYQIRTPVKDLGTVVVKIPKAALGGRIDDLRRRLLLSAAHGRRGRGRRPGARRGLHLAPRQAQRRARGAPPPGRGAGAPWGRLAANLAHEIRNPLNALSINLELLEEDLAGATASADGLELARREVGRLARLVNDFLVYARPTPPGLEEFDGRELLREVADAAAPGGRAGRRRASGDGGAGDRCWADRGQIYQVLVNLAQNAVPGAPRRAAKAGRAATSRQGGEPDASRGARQRAREFPRRTCAWSGRRSSRGARVAPGSGLAIAERIVSGHGGRLELLNRPEGGLRGTDRATEARCRDGVDSRRRFACGC